MVSSSPPKTGLMFLSGPVSSYITSRHLCACVVLLFTPLSPLQEG